MKFEDILPHLREGKRARRASWNPAVYDLAGDDGGHFLCVECWAGYAHTARAEVLREAHRELTTDELLRVSDHCDGTPGQITAAVRKADEIRKGSK